MEQQKKYCYKFDYKSPRGVKMRAFWRQAQHAEKEAEKYASRMEAAEWASDPNFFAGGVAYLFFKRTPDERIWRVAQKVDGEMGYEPNVIQRQMLVRVPHGMTPSNTWRDVYKQRPLSFEQVKDRYDIKRWCKVFGLSDSEDEQVLWAKVEKLAAPCDFFEMVRISPASSMDVNMKGEPKPSRIQRRAVKAQQLRQQLPVVPVASLYKLMDADMSVQHGDKRIGATPTFFYYFGKFYFCSDYPCKGEDLKEISIGDYRDAMLAAQKLLRKKS